MSVDSSEPRDPRRPHSDSSQDSGSLNLDLSDSIASVNREHLLSLICDSARVGLVVINDAYEYLFANKTYMSFFDLKPEQIIGRKVPDVLPHGWSQIQPHLLRALAGETVTYEATLGTRAESSEVRTYRVLYQPPGDYGIGMSVVVVIIDITESKRKEQAMAESESRYRRLVDVLPDAVFVNTNGRISFCNAACLKLLGATTADDIIGKSPFDVIHSSYHEVIAQRIDFMRSTGQAVSGIRQRVIRLDGQQVAVNVVATPITTAGEQSILVCMHDLSEQEQIADQLQSVLGSVKDAIVLINEEGIILLANEATREVLGYAPEELTGQPVKILMPEPYRHEHDGYIGAYLATGQAKIIGIGRELEALHKDGTTFPIELTISEFHWKDQRHFTGVIRDITKRKRLEAQFQQSQKMEAVGRLAGGVAHDFNNLLTVINGYSELISCQLSPEHPLLESIEAIQEAGQRAARLTKQLLTFSRKAQARPTILDLNCLIAESVKMLRRLIGEDINLRILPGENLFAVRADVGQMEQVLMNLLVNARDAMPEGGSLVIATRNIPLGDGSTSNLSANFVELSISDTGHGMSPAVTGKIFEPFFTTKDVGSGTGLGLAVVHGIVDQTGGHIEVDSRPGQGTTFRILLPAAK